MDSTRDPYRLIVESVRDYALILLDAEGNVTSWTPGAEAIKGYSAEEILGRHFSIFYPPEDRATRPARELELAASRGRFEEESWRVRKDGSRFLANVVVTPVKDAAGKVVGFAKVTRDLTERETQRRAIRVLSTPVVRLWSGILLMPLIGDVDETRADQMMATVLARVTEEQARVVILDVSGVPEMDTYVADTLLKMTTALRLVGAQTVITGISPHAAKTIVRLGVDLSQMTTQNQLAAGLDLALAQLGKSVADTKH